MKKNNKVCAPKAPGHFLFHFLLSLFRRPPDEAIESKSLQGRHLLAGVSGGVDSMVLLALLLELKGLFKWKVSVCHVHHGLRGLQDLESLSLADHAQREFQNKAQKLVKSFCRQNQADFYTNQPPPASTEKAKPLAEKAEPSAMQTEPSAEKAEPSAMQTNPLSEADLRQYRYQHLNFCLKKLKADYLVLAHTADDLLETQMMRLIRGTGQEGLKAMVFKEGQKLRPFLKVQRRQIKDYAQVKKIPYLDDPSNQNPKALRNWLRLKWLKSLEDKHPGALTAMARSLDLIAGQSLAGKNILKEAEKPSQKAGQSRVKGEQEGSFNQLYKKAVLSKNGLCRPVLLELSCAYQQRVLARFLREAGFKNYGLSHIHELLKRLQTTQKASYFTLLKSDWTIETTKIFFKPLPPAGR